MEKNYLYIFIENDKNEKRHPIRMHNAYKTNTAIAQANIQPNTNSSEIILCAQTKLRIKAKNAKIEQMYFSLYCLCFSSR